MSDPTAGPWSLEWTDAAGVGWRVRNLDGARLEREQGEGHWVEYGCPRCAEIAGPERHLRREANSLAFEVRTLLAALSDGGRPSDRILATLGCRLAAYELAADEVALLRAVGEEGEPEPATSPPPLPWGPFTTDRDEDRCSLCNCALNHPSYPLSRDCGGDCLRCMAEAGDSQALTVLCEMASSSRSPAAVETWVPTTSPGHQHVAAVVDNGRLSLYINGARVGGS